MKRVVLVGLIVIVSLGSGARAAWDGGGLSRVQTRGTLRWGGDVQGGEPYVFQDPHDSRRLIGFEVEIAEAVARRLGVRAEFVQNDWQTLIPSLERGDFDVILNGLEVTPARAAQVAFTRPYYAFTETLVVRRGAGTVRGLADLRGQRVGTLNNSLAFELATAAPGVEVVVYEGVEEPYIDLEQGRLTAVLLDNIIADRYGLVRPGLRAAGTVGAGVYAIAVRRGEDALRRAIDAALGAMREQGELRAILSRWNLWDEQQDALTQAAPAARPPASGVTLTGTHVVLFLRATGFTIVISTLAMALAVVGGLLLSVARKYGGGMLRTLAGTYVEVFRGTPVLLQLYVLYYGLAPILTLHAFTAAVVGLGMNYAAYEAEIYRAGLEAVPLGQTEAALSLGMSRPQALQRIVLPQALRVALPGIANDFIALLKDSSLVSVITVVELTKQMTITAVDVRSWLGPGLLCAALYLALSYPLSRLAQRLERRLAPLPR
jgi:polar amino acid transport system substrate-binding protein